MIVNRGHTWIRRIGDNAIQVEPERGALHDNFFLDALFDCLHKDAIHLLEDEAAAGQMGHLCGEINDEVSKLLRGLPVGKVSGSSINKGQSLELSRFVAKSEKRFLENDFKNIKGSCKVVITGQIQFQSRIKMKNII